MDRFNPKFWANNYFISSLITGITVLAISLSILEAWRSERANQRWQEIAKVTYKDLSRACRDIVAVVQVFYVSSESLLEISGKEPKDILDPWDLNLLRLISLHKRIELPNYPRKEPENTHYSKHRHFPKEIARRLFSDSLWREWADGQIDRSWTRHCELVAMWSSLMMESDESRTFLNYFAMLDHDLRRIYYGLLDYNDSNEEFEKLWLEINLLDVRSRILYNRLRGAAKVDSVSRPDIIKYCTIDRKDIEKIFDPKLGSDEILSQYCKFFVKP